MAASRRFENADGESLCQNTQKRGSCGGGTAERPFVEMRLLVETLREWHQSLSETMRGFGACGRTAERAHTGGAEPNGNVWKYSEFFFSQTWGGTERSNDAEFIYDRYEQ